MVEVVGGGVVCLISIRKCNGLIKMFGENCGEICRFCLRQEPGMLSIFEIPWDDANSILAEKITFVAPIQIDSDDGLPASICSHCREQVDRFYDFRVLVEVSDRTLRTHLHESQLGESNIKTICEESDTLIQHSNEPFIHSDFLSVDAIVLPIENGLQVWKIPAADKDQESMGLPKAEVNKASFDPIELSSKSNNINCPEYDVQERESTVCLKEDNDTVCQLCCQTFSSLSDLKNHISEHLIVNDTKKVKETPNEKQKILKEEGQQSKVRTDNCLRHTLSCAKCKKSFTTTEEYNLHVKRHVSTRSYKCKFCNRTFIRSTCRKLHELHHIQEKKHVCSECNKAFVKRSELRHHKGTHVNIPPTCTICNKHFQTIQSFKIHMKRHTLGTRYICEVCGKNYYTNSELARHLQTHSGLRKHPCTICEMSFFSRPELNRHLKYHTGEKKFKCNICFKSYFESGHLKIHERVHTGERPFLCTFCGKTFISRSKLLRHKKIHDKDGLSVEPSQ